MREAVVEAKLAVGETREAVARTERDLTQERQRLADAERRGRLASEIQDRETVEVAQLFAAKHRERAEVLAKKLGPCRGSSHCTSASSGTCRRSWAGRNATGRSPRRSARRNVPGATCRQPGDRVPEWIRRTSCSRHSSTAPRARPQPTGSSASSRRR